MVADSFTDSELFHGSPISRGFSKKSKMNRLKQWKIDAFRKQLIYQYDEEISHRLKKLTDTKSWRIDYEEGSYGFTKFNDEIGLENSSSFASSPTSVLKRQGSVNEDCFCCSKPMSEKGEEEDVFEDAYDNWGSFGEALNSSDNDKDENSQLEKEDSEQEEEDQDDKRVKPPETSSEETIERKSKKMEKLESNSEKQDDDVCPICADVMDATDLAFKPCPCGYQVCLFCHKQISENDSRCPGCRRKYDKKSDDDTQERFQLRGRGPITLSPSFKGLHRV